MRSRATSAVPCTIASCRALHILVGLALRDYQEVAAAAVDVSVDSHEKQE
jgi:hypothetical protein